MSTIKLLPQLLHSDKIMHVCQNINHIPNFKTFTFDSNDFQNTTVIISKIGWRIKRFETFIKLSFRKLLVVSD